MSAIEKALSDFGNPIASYKTRVKVHIHSHVNPNPIVFTKEVLGFSTNKTTKTTGSMTLTVVPAQNILNTVFPNDYINLYVDRNDGSGWTRLFFGLIDRVQEDYSVSENGTPTTRYTIECSDFQKIFEATQIYFNPSIAPSRKDIQADWFGALNIGGVFLRSKGLAATGSPPDIILLTLFVLLGSAGQFVLPKEYIPTTKTKFRAARVSYIVSKLGLNLLQQIPSGHALQDFLADSEREAVLTKGNLSSFTSSVDPSLAQEVAEDITAAYKGKNVNDIGLQVLGSLDSVKSKVVGFLDILDVFTFVEREAIDGYCDSTSYWERDGTVMSFLISQSNEIVNELFFDLRPVTTGVENDPLPFGVTEQWSREPDEIGGNVDLNQERAAAPGIQYVPALIFREYPFSTISSIDASDVNTKIRGQNGKLQTVGKIQFGPIFCDQPFRPGRHIVDVENINVEDRYRSNIKSAKKILDVAVIDTKEIISSSLGRSDTDTFNLLQVISEGSVLETDEKFFLQDMMPILTPISIARIGLRVRTLQTIFARFTPQSVAKNKTPLEITLVKDTPAADPAFTGSVAWPVPSNKTVSSKWGIWRKHTNSSLSTYVRGEPNEWALHHGIDIPGTDGQTQIVAAADGEVVAVAATGTPGFKGYGNCVIIKHANPYKGQQVYSVYAHMHSIFDTLWTQSGNANKSLEPLGVCKEIKSTGKGKAFKIAAGTPLGYVGRTSFADSAGNPTYMFSGAHLHFEIIKKYPAKNGGPVSLHWNVSNVPFPAEAPALPDQSTLFSMDPEEFLATATTSVSTPESDAYDDGKDDDGAGVDVAKEQVEPEIPFAPSDDYQSSNNVDSGYIRNQLIRWALLQDHWYQHNSEYLSGTIRMRGAPEIRVGYRLDVNGRGLSFYVEGVSHSWTFPSPMETTLLVKRGQPNSPFPSYVLPALPSFTPVDVQRKTSSRLGRYFIVGDPTSVRNNLSIMDLNSASLNYDVEKYTMVDPNFPLDPESAGAIYETNEVVVQAGGDYVIKDDVKGILDPLKLEPVDPDFTAVTGKTTAGGVSNQ